MNRRKKWQETTASYNFTHSSRKAWNSVKRLGAETSKTNLSDKVSPNDVATRLMRVAKTKMDKQLKTDIKKRLRSKKKEMVKSAIYYSSDFSTDEIRMVLKEIKLNKAAGFDGVYSEFFKHSGHKTQAWLATFCSDILDTATLPKLFKKTKIIAILKPGKLSTDATHYRPISLLSTTYKILERLILNRIQPEIEKILPVEQAGFRTNRSCAEQVLALTILIEKGFQINLKTNEAFIDLTAAYDTVWRHGLLYKLANVIPCKKILTLIENMLSNRRFQVFMGDKKSRWRISNDGLPLSVSPYVIQPLYP